MSTMEFSGLGRLWKTGNVSSRDSTAQKSRILLALSGVYILCLLLVGLVGGYTISTQNRATVRTLQMSQTRVDEASRTQTAILTMGKAQALLISASDAEERRTAAILAIRSLS